MQEMMGMIGCFVAHPERTYTPRADHDFGMILQEWAVLPNNTCPKYAAMEYNWLTFNGASAPAINSDDREAGQPSATAHRQSGDGPPPDSSARKSIRHDRNGRRPRAGIDVVSDEHGAGGRGAGASRGIRCEVSGRVDGALPSAAPHDEQHDGSSTRPRDRNGQHQRRKSAGSRWKHWRTTCRSNTSIILRSQTTRISVPGFPQDAFMEMGMDDAVEKPETHGLPKNWSAGMMGMMTMDPRAARQRVRRDDPANKITAGTTERKRSTPMGVEKNSSSEAPVPLLCAS